MGTNEGVEGDGLCQQLGYDLMAAAIEVHRELGCGFLEEVYHEAFEIELQSRGIPFASKPQLTLLYKGNALRKRYQADLVVADQIIVELKSVRMLAPEHDAQLIHYLKATRKRVGYLLNFSGHPKLQWKRLVL